MRPIPLLLALACATAAAPPPPASPPRAPGPDDAFGLQFERRTEQGTLYLDPRGNAEVFVPKGFRLVAPVESRQLAYDFAIKHETLPYEVRVRFDRPSATRKQLDECREKNRAQPGSCAMADPDHRSSMLAQTIGLNLGGEMRFAASDDAWVRERYAADWGLSGPVFTIGDKNFAGPYSVAQISQVHRN